ncbi:aminotransferase class V-fold PLP-dependent enzyme [Segetibacter koreensis]|uniref:aminotransferase class V-fold PLP-dependent enzyme n=1 Tax=Segetibacter koreensis TaxID=398037 RepID=UPI0003804429|nr:aminotransferase class V-fold PLP-dependent enzyme [Segetibacter koreensis]
MKRRDLLKYFSLGPLTGAAISAVPFKSAIAAPSNKPKRDMVKELGLRTFINAAGTYTFMTASLMPDEVMEAINSSSKEFIMYDEVQDKAGEKIAALCHAEAAMVTAGCWSALVLGTAGVLTGMDLEKVAQLPNVDSFEKNEVIVQKGHNHDYIHALTNTGIKPVVVETMDDLEKAINAKTALMYFLNESTPHGKILHKEWLEVAKKHNIPTIIDIAADIPPVENLWKYSEMGFDLICVSGGKAIRGPQSAGLLYGKKDLVAAARLSAPPRGGNIGRGMKVNKEEILGMYAALDRYVKQDHEKEWKEWEEKIAIIENAAKKVKGVTTEVTVPPIANHTPALKISWDTSVVKTTPKDLQARLREGNPSIEVMSFADNTINITVFMLKPGQEKIVATRINEELTKASA